MQRTTGAVLLALLFLPALAHAQATVMPDPRQQWLTNAGAPCNACTLTTYLAGTSTLQSLYTNSGLSVAAPNPVTMNSAGRPEVSGTETNLYQPDFNMKFVLATSGGTILWTADNVRPNASTSGVVPSTFAVGDLLYADTTSSLAKLADVSAGSYLRSGGLNTAPLWSTLKIPNTATTGDLPYASSANTVTMLAAGGTAGMYLRNGGASTAPLWSTLILPNAATANRLVYASATNTFGESANLTFDGSTFTTLAMSGTSGTFSTTVNVTGDLTVGGGDLIASADMVVRRNTSDASDTGSLSLAGGGALGTSRGAGIVITGNENGTPGSVQIFQGNISNSAIIFYDRSSTMAFEVEDDNVRSLGVYNNTDAAAANVVVQSDGTLERSTSSARYKTNIRELGDWRWFLKLRPVSFNTLNNPTGRTWGGFLAEDMAQHSPLGADGTPLFAGLDPQGRPDDIPYAYLTAVIQQGLVDHEARLAKQLDLIAGLEARLTALEAENAALRARPGAPTR